MNRLPTFEPGRVYSLELKRGKRSWSHPVARYLGTERGMFVFNVQGGRDMKIYVGDKTLTIIVQVIDGDRTGPLPHIARHSEAFGWGYSGSGPADLARSLLLDALEDPLCPACRGAGEVVYRASDDMFIPAGDPDAQRLTERDTELQTPCFDCSGDGLREVPYAAFRDEVVARLPETWVLTQRAILDWGAEHAKVRS